MKANFLSLEWKDGARALFLSVVTSAFTLILQTLEAGSLTFDWQKIGTVAATTAVAYILKNWLTNSNDELLKKE